MGRILRVLPALALAFLPFAAFSCGGEDGSSDSGRASAERICQRLDDCGALGVSVEECTNGIAEDVGAGLAQADVEACADCLDSASCEQAASCDGVCDYD